MIRDPHRDQDISNLISRAETLEALSAIEREIAHEFSDHHRRLIQTRMVALKAKGV